MKSFKVLIFNYQNLVNEYNVQSLTFQSTAKGKITVLCDHSPLISDIANSTLKLVDLNGKFKEYKINKGIFYFRDNVAKIMTEKISLVKNQNLDG